MATTTVNISSIGELRSVLMEKIKFAMIQLSREMSDDAGKLILTKFYQAYTPERYQRTGQLLRSVNHPKITFTSSSVEIKVFVDFDSMKHVRYGGESITVPTKRSGYRSNERELAMSASQGFHGIASGYFAAVTSGHFWELLEKKWTPNKIEERLKHYLIVQGLTVT